MIEIPEARTIAKDLKKEILGKTVVDVLGTFTGHKFTFYYNNPEKYKEYLVGKKVTNIIERNFYVEIEIEDYILLLRDGINLRYYDNRQDFPEKSKLLLEFQDGSFINMTVSMYGAISVFNKNEEFDNEYYLKEINGISPLDDNFTYDYFKSLITEETLKLSAKAFLATEQRILGVGNGIVQDILFVSGINPKTKIRDLDDEQIKKLYESLVNTIKKMIEAGGRNTEKNIYGENGGYKTILSNKTYKNPCPVCHGEIKKENYLGGSIYYCPDCQK